MPNSTAFETTETGLKMDKQGYNFGLLSFSTGL